MNERRPLCISIIILRSIASLLQTCLQPKRIVSKSRNYSQAFEFFLALPTTHPSTAMLCNKIVPLARDSHARPHTRARDFFSKVGIPESYRFSVKNRNLRIPSSFFTNWNTRIPSSQQLFFRPKIAKIRNWTPDTRCTQTQV